MYLIRIRHHIPQNFWVFELEATKERKFGWKVVGGRDGRCGQSSGHPLSQHTQDVWELVAVSLSEEELDGEYTKQADGDWGSD